MYASFYNLKKEPFHITPDPEFLYLSPSHKEALGSIVYGVGQRKGFVLITGEVGVGKTTIIRSYLEQIEKENLKIIYAFNANVSFPGLLKTIYQELGMVALTDEVFELVNQLHEVLIEEYRKGINVVLIIDEAQNMPLETLENLRMLSNLETSKDKLIQIVFIGQPEFEQKLDMKELRQLKQRIAVKSTIVPLSPEESLAYIRHRIAKVSTGNAAFFTGGALRRIVKRARGIPRVINILCENSFITALGYRQKKITSRVAREVIADFSGRKKKRFANILAPVSALGFLVLCGGFMYQYKDAVLSSTGFRTLTSVFSGEAADNVKNSVRTVNNGAAPVDVNAAAAAAEISIPSQNPEGKEFPVVKTVRKGDTLSRLVEEVYGISNRYLIARVKDNNSSIHDVDVIEIGETIIFPAREKRSGKSHE